MFIKETFKYTGVENLPNPSWKEFFSMSEMNKNYIILKTTEFQSVEVANYEPVYETQAITRVVPKINIELNEDGEIIAMEDPTGEEGEETTLVEVTQDEEVFIKNVNVPIIHTLDLVMCNTEYEFATNQPLFDLLEEYTAPKVLVIGYGIGLIIPKLLEANAEFTIIEINQEIVDLEDVHDTSAMNIIISDIGTVDLTQLGQFDIIWNDCDSNAIIPRIEELESHLTSNGKYIKWDNLPNQT